MRPAVVRYLTIEDAAYVAGMTEARLRRLARSGELPWRGGSKDPLFALSDLAALGSEPGPAFPEWLGNDLPSTPRRRGRPPTFAPDKVVRGHVLDVLRVIPSGSVSAVVCSPPYWGQRVYVDETPVIWGDGKKVAFGREDTPEDYVAHTLQILKGLLRVLASNGTVWWNIADSYFTRTIARTSSADRIDHYAGKTTTWAGNPHRRSSYGHSYLKDKDLSLIPFHIATGAQRLGYWVRSIIVWSKQQAVDDFHDVYGADAESNGRAALANWVNPSGLHVPEVVRDRPVTAHEYIVLLTKADSYEYNHLRLSSGGPNGAHNVGTVWTFPPAVSRGVHGARYPDELPRRCILLGSKKDDLIFDPFAGEGTTLRMAKANRRRYFGCDISPTYVREARAAVGRTRREPPGPVQAALPELTDI